jgi:hypothetical protein
LAHNLAKGEIMAKVLEGTCKTCGTKFAFEKAEKTETTALGYLTTCPKCHSTFNPTGSEESTDMPKGQVIVEEEQV